MTARYVYASWKTGVYLVMVKALLTSFAIEVRGDLPGITNEDCTDTGATTEQWGDFRTGTSETCTVFQVQFDKTQQQRSIQLHQWRTHHRDEQISAQQHASNQKTTEHNARAKLEQTLGKMQQLFADNAEAEASRKSAEKERRTVEQTERQAAQAAQQAIWHDIHITLDSIFTRFTAIEETQQRDWQTQLQQYDKIQKIETQMLQQQLAMQHYERYALNIQAGDSWQNKIRQREQEPVQ